MWTLSRFTADAQTYLNLSWPAVSQIWSLIRFPGSISTNLEKKSTPTVGSETWAKRPSVKRRIRHDFPTVESPMTISLNWYTQIASIFTDLRISFHWSNWINNSSQEDASLYVDSNHREPTSHWSWPHINYTTVKQQQKSEVFWPCGEAAVVARIRANLSSL